MNGAPCTIIRPAGSLLFVHHPLHDALLLITDIHGQDERGVRTGGGVTVADAMSALDPVL